MFDVKQALDYLLAHMRAEQSDIEHELVWRTPLSVLLEDQSFQKQDFVYALQGERPMSFLALLKQAFGRGDK